MASQRRLEATIYERQALSSFGESHLGSIFLAGMAQWYFEIDIVESCITYNSLINNWVY